MTNVQTPSDVPPALPPQSGMVRWLAPLFLIAGIGLVPWTVRLPLPDPETVLAGSSDRAGTVEEIRREMCLFGRNTVQAAELIMWNAGRRIADLRFID
jgi:hypothetical protein